MPYLRKIIVLAFFLSFLGGRLSAWNCTDAHPAINKLAAENFMVRADNELFGEKYQHMHIDTAAEFEGLTYAKATMRERSGAVTNIKTTFSGWLQRGGHDADVPQIEMGFRHFYDPVYEPHYLTWMRRWYKKPDKKKFASEADYFKTLDYRADDWNPNLESGSKTRKFKLIPKILRPQKDAISWGLIDAGNEHNFSEGLRAFKAAMENDKAAFGKLSQSQMFGKAFRCLGETMHLMGDMTQPAHVRADSHSAYEPVEKAVTGEMIKKIIGDAHKNANFKPVDEFVIEKGLSPDQLMQKVAVFTNSNFFSNDTIFDYEIWTFPRNHKKPYPSPQLSRLTQVKGVYYARFTPVGWVPLAKETGSVFAMVLNDSDKYGRKHPKFHVLQGMAEAQAKVLVPLAVYNCAELINDFIPSFRLDAALKNVNGNTY
ncbi:MAG: hypothetical protein EOM80_14445, partial [Erysipelotrichia bacterium]|nr:hypothetical protein [Erysipelotrichia bacterium]